MSSDVSVSLYRLQGARSQKAAFLKNKRSSPCNHRDQAKCRIPEGLGLRLTFPSCATWIEKLNKTTSWNRRGPKLGCREPSVAVVFIILQRRASPLFSLVLVRTIKIQKRSWWGKRLSYSNLHAVKAQPIIYNSSRKFCALYPWSNSTDEWVLENMQINF
jgi:hypothetical protein